MTHTELNTEKRILMRAERNPLTIPEAVTVKVEGQTFSFSSTKGSMSYNLHPDVTFSITDGVISFTLTNPKSREQVGTARKRIENILKGLTVGFEKKLLLVGVGYKAKLEGSSKINLSLGKSHPDIYDVPAAVTVTMPNQTEIVLQSIDNVLLGQVAANIRSLRPPEPYKGKGIRYSDESISLKEVKKQ
ncbi:MAG: 50S ribosomal protein L6 [Pseudomonadota bacterium]|nr:50S ribosomal protein L6 [Pseudomonadota bacterium]